MEEIMARAEYKVSLKKGKKKDPKKFSDNWADFYD